VYGSDQEKIGDVSEVGPNYIVVSKGWLFTRDIYIPMAAVVSVQEDSVFLNVTKDQVESMGWDQPPADDTYASIAGTATTTEAMERADYTAASTGAGVSDRVGAEDVAIPVVEEELKVGKRETESGGVRVTTRVEERPVVEQVTLREERVDVERRPVDRPVTDADLAAVQEGVFEVQERSEELVVDKQARIVEEVVINKDVAERTETIQDTVRRTDVDVREIPGETRTTGYSNTAGTSGTAATGSGAGSSSSGDEGMIERGLSKAENTAERTTGLDLDRDQDVGQRDPRNNY
jgi:uncharacterized protein (TIGR02271 family)